MSLDQTTLVRNVLRMLGEWTIEDTHTNTLTSSSTSLTVASDATTRWEIGDYLDWIEDATYECAVVTGVTATALTVRRGAMGTTASAHSANAVIRKITGGRFLGWNASKAVTDSLENDTWPELFAVWQASLTPNTGSSMWYPIAYTAEEVMRIYQQDVTTHDPIDLHGYGQPTYVDSGVSATLKAINIPAPVHPTQTMYVQYTAILTVTELSTGSAHVIEYGAARRLLEWDAAAKTPSLRPASGTLAPGQGMRDAAWFLQMQQRALKQEESMLVRRFPRRRKNFFKNAANRHYSDRVR